MQIMTITLLKRAEKFGVYTSDLNVPSWKANALQY